MLNKPVIPEPTQAEIYAFLAARTRETFGLPAKPKAKAQSKPQPRPQSRLIGSTDHNWKEQRLTDLTVKAHELAEQNLGLCEEEADELDWLAAELGEKGVEEVQCERRWI